MNVFSKIKPNIAPLDKRERQEIAAALMVSVFASLFVTGIIAVMLGDNRLLSEKIFKNQYPIILILQILPALLSLVARNTETFRGVWSIVYVLALFFELTAAIIVTLFVSAG